MAGAQGLMRVAWEQRRGLQRGGDGCELLPPPRGWGLPGTAGDGAGRHAPGSGPAARVRPGAGGGSACKWSVFPEECKKNDLSAGVLAAALKRCAAPLRLFPRFPLAGR